MSTLNDQQHEAVQYLDGPCLVLAGAGSGKTRVIIQKIQHLIDLGTPPNTIAAITFTNKSAEEMLERLSKTGASTKKTSPFVGTFHALGLSILREETEHSGLKPKFSIIDQEDSADILRDILGTTDAKTVRAVQRQISNWKSALRSPEQTTELATTSLERLAAQAYQKYVSALSAYQSADFDDLILRPTQTLLQHLDATHRWQQKFRYILVDEYQDTNSCQYALFKLLSGDRGAFTVVGDEAQSIYGWRGANTENISRLSQDYKNLRVIKLEQNYRSSQSILTAANLLIEKNTRLYAKRLWSELGNGDPVQVTGYLDEAAEAESVVMRLQASKFTRKGRLSDYAVLYRSNYQARVLEQSLRKEKIPYVMSGGQSFFDRAEIRDILAYLRLLVNDQDDPAFIRAAKTPKRGIGLASLQTLGAYAGQRKKSLFEALFETGIEATLAKQQLDALRLFGHFINTIQYRAARESPAAVLDDLIRTIGYETYLADSCDEKTAAKRWKNVCDFLDWVKQRGEQENATLLKISQILALLSQLDPKEKEADAVRLSTIHAAKGLEFPHVFIVGCEEGILPYHTKTSSQEHPTEATEETEDTSSGNVASLQSIEEERRLMYVAVTRAQRTLALTWSKGRGAKSKDPQSPSRFIEEMGLSSSAESQRTPLAEGKMRLASLRSLLQTNS